MRIQRLVLENFRNVVHLDLELPPGRVVLHGDNAQGKTNLLEAVYIFAVARSVRASHDRELISQQTLGDEMPFTRLTGVFDRGDAPLKVEIVLQLTRDTEKVDPAPQLQKRIRINGVPRRASDLVGEVQAVLFEPQDIDLVYGSPSLRRRHLDLTLSQVDRALMRELQRYARVLQHRNPLLKAIREGRASPSELGFWDQELVEAGSSIVSARAGAITEIAAVAAEIHRELTGGVEELRLLYRPSVPLENVADAGIPDAFRAALEAAREKEHYQGATLVGPHRDDFEFVLDDLGLATFGSRGQHRLATLSLKLAEARFMMERTGVQPLLLLDDILSELDAQRRSYLLSFVESHAQAIITTADLPFLGETFLTGAALFRVSKGVVEATAPSR